MPYNSYRETNQNECVMGIGSGRELPHLIPAAAAAAHTLNVDLHVSTFAASGEERHCRMSRGGKKRNLLELSIFTAKMPECRR